MLREGQARTGDGILRIANCSGFYGDRLSAAREMVEGGPIDVLTGDYLAELTMLILWKARQRDPGAGYAVSFLAQMHDVLGTCLERGIKVVVNAGGLNPAGLAARLGTLAGAAGLRPRIAHVEGDDLLARLPRLQKEGHDLAHLATGRPLAGSGAEPVTANAYLGGWGITEALRAGADVVICGRVTDAALVAGPAAWAFDWATDDWDRLAGAVTAGHIIECGAQATGGNYAFFTELDQPLRPGFPIAELRADGSAVITKHPGTGGAVTVDTVTAQLLYEIGGPAYLNPDVIARFDTVRLRQLGPDRVQVSGARGNPPPTRSRSASTTVAVTAIPRSSRSPDSTSRPRPPSPRPPSVTPPAAPGASPRTTSGWSTVATPRRPPPGSPSPSRTPTRTPWAARCSPTSSAPACPATPGCTWSTSPPGRGVRRLLAGPARRRRRTGRGRPVRRHPACRTRTAPPAAGDPAAGLRAAAGAPARGPHRPRAAGPDHRRPLRRQGRRRQRRPLGPR